MRQLLIIIAISLSLIGNIIFAQSHQLFSDILSRNVKSGLVNYEELKNDERFEKYLTQLSNTNPEKLSQKEKLAFWINAYNAFTIKIIVENYPVESITNLNTGGKIIGFLIDKTVWDKKFISINGKKYSLGDIEHKILRKMNEPRIHFSIVCASISCPKLRNEAFEADKIEVQLKSQTVKFINDKERNYFDIKNKEAFLSKIFSWFSADFGESDENILKFIALYLPENISSDINNNLDKWVVSYKDYNWNLNKQK